MNVEDITVGAMVSFVNKDDETITAEVTKAPFTMKNGLTVVFLKGVRGFVTVNRLVALA